MSSSAPGNEPPLDLPTMMHAAEYRISVRGRLPHGATDRLSGLSIESIDGEGATAVTHLRGRLADQAALVGAINTLYASHHPVISVQVMGAAPQGDGDVPS